MIASEFAIVADEDNTGDSVETWFSDVYRQL